MKRRMVVGVCLTLWGLGGVMAETAHAATTEQRYQSSCVSCHGSGAAGAPRKGDAAAWAPRLQQGDKVLLAHIRNGFKAMPPRGLCNDCSDDEYRSLINYMSR